MKPDWDELGDEVREVQEGAHRRCGLHGRDEQAALRGSGHRGLPRRSSTTRPATARGASTRARATSKTSRHSSRPWARRAAPHTSSGGNETQRAELDGYMAMPAEELQAQHDEVTAKIKEAEEAHQELLKSLQAQYEASDKALKALKDENAASVKLAATLEHAKGAAAALDPHGRRRPKRRFSALPISLRRMPLHPTRWRGHRRPRRWWCRHDARRLDSVAERVALCAETHRRAVRAATTPARGRSPAGPSTGPTPPLAARPGCALPPVRGGEKSANTVVTVVYLLFRSPRTHKTRGPPLRARSRCERGPRGADLGSLDITAALGHTTLRPTCAAQPRRLRRERRPRRHRPAASSAVPVSSHG